MSVPALEELLWVNQPEDERVDDVMFLTERDDCERYGYIQTK
jgi:hypothetical protein